MATTKNNRKFTGKASGPKKTEAEKPAGNIDEIEKVQEEETEEELDTEEPTMDTFPEYNPSELVIKEIMIQKGCSRDLAIQILRNPTK